MMLPGLACLFINNYIPMAPAHRVKNVNFADGIWASPWATPGGKTLNICLLPKTYGLLRAIQFVQFITVNTAMAIFSAILICDIASKQLKRLYQSAILLPFLMSYVIVSYIVFALLSNENGLLNKTLLPALGMEPINWYASPQYWPVILVLVNFWKASDTAA
ncbi:MAG: hypothetical protein ACLSBB_17150 [Ruthenibacterium lactatiformans]